MNDIESSEINHPKEFVKKTIDEITGELKRGDLEREYIIDGDLSKYDLQTLLNLPIEVAITEHRGLFILTPNPDTPKIFQNDAYLERQNNSKLFLHTHYKTPGLTVNTPSFADILMSLGVSENTLMAIAHTDGITQFGHIKINPLTGEPVKSNKAGSVISEYADSIGITFSRRYETAEKPFIRDKYTSDERTQLARDFAQKSGMIIAEANYSDAPNIEHIIKVINSRKS